MRADIIITATNSATLVFDGRDVKGGAHVNAIGAFSPKTREFDSHLVLRSKVVVETKAGFLEEAGELLITMRSWEISAEHIHAELGEVEQG